MRGTASNLFNDASGFIVRFTCLPEYRRSTANQLPISSDHINSLYINLYSSTCDSHRQAEDRIYKCTKKTVKTPQNHHRTRALTLTYKCHQLYHGIIKMSTVSPSRNCILLDCSISMPIMLVTADQSMAPQIRFFLKLQCQ